MSYFTTPDNCKLYYTIDNFKTDRPVVIFLNGTGQTTINWEPHVAAFAKHFRVLRYDARSQGKSDIGIHHISAEIHIRDLTYLLEHLNVHQAHLVGISHGAYIALCLAAKAPEWIDRLVLCSIGRDSQAYVKQIVHSWLQILQRSDLTTMAWAVIPLVFGKCFLNQNQTILDKIAAAIAIRNNKDALIAHFKAINNYPLLETFMNNIRYPTLVISGADDPIVSQPDARQLAKDCHGQYKMFAETGHSIPAEAPALFQQLVLGFLNQK